MGHGIAGIYRQVQQDLIKLDRVGLQHTNGWLQFYNHLNIFANNPFQKLVNILDQLVQVYQLRLQDLAAAESQQLVS